MALVIEELHSARAADGSDDTASISVAADDLIIVFYGDDALRTVSGFGQTFLGGSGGGEYLAYYHFDSPQSGVITISSFGYQKPYKIFRVANFGATDWQSRVIPFTAGQNAPTFSYTYGSYTGGEILSAWEQSLSLNLTLDGQHTVVGAELLHNGNSSELVVAKSASDTLSATASGTSYFGFTAVELVESVTDTTAPVLSTPTGTKTGTTTASGTVTTDEGNGTLYFYASTNATETAATIKASGASQAVSVSGSQSVSFTGLTASTTYYAHYVQDDTAANESNVANSTSFTTDAATTTLNSIDADNNVQVGQTGVVIATTGVDPASVVQTVTLGGEALTVTAWTNVGGNAQITVTIPAAIALKWGRTDLTLSVTDDAGTYTLGGITLSAPTGWESVAFTTAPNEATTESFYEYAKTDATIGSYTLVAGDVLAWTTSTGLTVDGQTIPTVSPAATVTGSYKVWKELTSTWTAESTYTITDLGVFVEPAVLSSASASYSSATSAIATVNTDSITGTLYGYVSTNATELAATIKASGASQAVTSSTESMVFAGLTTDTTYYTHFIQNNGQDSNVITTNSFTPQVSASGDARAIVTSMVSNIVSNMVN